MKIKLLSLVLAGSALAATAWIVHRNNVPNPNALALIAQGGEPNPDQAGEAPDKYAETIRKGLEYLVKNQHKDGHWEGDGGQHPVAMTGLAGLALLMDKYGRRYGKTMWSQTKGPEGNYSDNVRKATDWLMDKSQPGRDGLIYSEHPSETARYMQGHGLATLFLAGANEVENDNVRANKLTDVLTRAVKYIVKAQSSQGGWYRTSKVEGHDFDEILTTVIQIQALQAAENVGIPVPQETIVAAQEYLKMAIGKGAGKTKPGRDRSRQAETAGALAGTIPYREAEGEGRQKWFDYCRAEIPVGRAIRFGRDELSHYYYAQAEFYRGGDSWNAYRTAMFEHLRSNQNKDGSWPAGDGLSVGPVYSTAVWCTILQLEKNSHPVSRRIGKMK